MYDFEDDKFFTDSKDHPMNEPIEVINNTTDEESADEDTKELLSPVPGQSQRSGQSKRKMLSEKRSTLRQAEKERASQMGVNYYQVDTNKLTEEQKKQKQREKFEVKFLSFPTTSGISGHVFKTK